MSNYDINKMDYKQLRNEVQLLRDELAIMKRKFEDIIYNLDADNFSQRIVKQGKDMYTKIEQTAEEISLQAEKIGKNSKNIASLEITADEISSEVFYVDENGEKQSVITQTADEIKAEVSDVAEELTSEITQTATAIKAVVSKNISAKFISNNKPTYNNTSDKEKGMLCEYDGTLYYYNDVTETWKIYPYADGVKSQFIQTLSGFDLTGDVSISGDLITEGSIKGIDIVGTKYWDSQRNGYIFLRPLSGTCDFEMYNASQNQRIFRIYDEITGVGFSSYDYTFLRAALLNETTFAYGTWDFSNCASLNLGDNAPKAVFA